MINDFIETNKSMDSYYFEYCPKCGAYHPVLVKAGKTKAGKQMLKCNVCNKRFVCDHGQLTFYSHQSQAKWNDLIIETQNGNSILKTAVQRLGNCIARSFNVAKPRMDDVLQFSRYIEDKSYVWTDGLVSYKKVLEEKKCENKILVSYKSYDSVNHLNNVNSFHSQIQAQYTIYKGVSSK